MGMSILQNVFEKGGPVMWPLAACSLIALTVTLERLMFWFRERLRRDDRAMAEVWALVERGEFEQALSAGKKRPGFALRMTLKGLKDREHGFSQVMQVEASGEIEAMKQGLSVLDTIITLAPLLGILGTVIGIIESFDLLGASGIEDPKAVTGGIAQALITTAAGLAIAIATLIPFNYFVSRTERAARRLEEIAAQLEVALRRGRAGRREHAG